MSYRQLTYEERVTLSTLSQQGLSVRAIARTMKRHHSTLYRELDRNRCHVCLPAIKSTTTYTGTAQPITEKPALHRNGFFIDPQAAQTSLVTRTNCRAHSDALA